MVYKMQLIAATSKQSVVFKICHKSNTTASTAEEIRVNLTHFRSTIERWVNIILMVQRI